MVALLVDRRLLFDLHGRGDFVSLSLLAPVFVLFNRLLIVPSSINELIFLVRSTLFYP